MLYKPYPVQAGRTLPSHALWWSARSRSSLSSAIKSVKQDPWISLDSPSNLINYPNRKYYWLDCARLYSWLRSDGVQGTGIDICATFFPIIQYQAQLRRIGNATLHCYDKWLHHRQQSLGIWRDCLHDGKHALTYELTSTWVYYQQNVNIAA